MNLEHKHIFKGFNYFYQKLYSHKTKYTPKAEQLCLTFLSLLEKRYGSVGEEFLWRYFIFQFSYWKDLEIKSFNQQINLSYIIGRKAFERFIARNSEYDWQINEDSRQYSKADFHKAVGFKQQLELSGYDCDELYRQMYFNNPQGLSNCLTYTSLFQPKSNTCQTCIHKFECKDMQRELYPRIYRNRKIDESERAAG